MQHPRQGTRPAGSSLFRDFVRRTFCGLSARDKDSFIEKFRNFRRFPENSLDFVWDFFAKFSGFLLYKKYISLSIFAHIPAKRTK